MENETDLEMLYRIRSREDGWTRQVMKMFIIQLIETGSVRKAAMNVDRHVTTAYRLRARDPAFAKAWDAARRMAYARLRPAKRRLGINSVNGVALEPDDIILTHILS